MKYVLLIRSQIYPIYPMAPASYTIFYIHPIWDKAFVDGFNHEIDLDKNRKV
jgi:hypothetical protein